MDTTLLRLEDEADLLTVRISTWDQDESLLPEKPALRALIEEAARMRQEKLRVIERAINLLVKP